MAMNAGVAEDDSKESLSKAVRRPITLGHCVLRITARKMHRTTRAPTCFWSNRTHGPYAVQPTWLCPDEL